MPSPDLLAAAARRALFLNTIGSAEERRRVLTASSLALAADGAYRAWAHARGLDAMPGAHRFRGEVFGRRVCFFTGLSGTTPIQVELSVAGMVPIAEATLLERTTRSASLAATALHRLFRTNELETIGLTRDRVRLRLAPLVPLDAIDRTLEVLCSMLDRLEGNPTRTA